MNVLRIFALFILSVSTTLSQAAWKEYESSNFIIISDERERLIDDLIESINATQATLNFIWKREAISSNNPKLKIFVFSKNRDFKEYSINQNLAGFYSQTGNSPYIFMGSESQKNVILHEVAHHFQIGGNSFNFPEWYVEGFAELVSTIETKRGVISFGKAPERLRILSQRRPMKIRDLFERKYDNDIISSNVFYATSWALIKTILFSDDRELSVGFDNYATQYAMGDRIFESAIKSIGKSEKYLDELLRNSLARSRKSEITLTANIPKNEIKINEYNISKKKLSDEEFSLHIASFLLSYSDYTGIVNILRPHYENGNELTRLYYHYARNMLRPYSTDEFVGFTDLVSSNSPENLRLSEDKDKSVYFSLAANFYFDRGDSDKAKEYCAISLDLDPLNIKARLIKTKLLLVEGNYLEAGREASLINEFLPRSLDSLASNFYTSVLLGEYSDADDYIDKIKFLFRSASDRDRANLAFTNLSFVAISYSDNLKNRNSSMTRYDTKIFTEKLSNVPYSNLQEIEKLTTYLKDKNRSLSLIPEKFYPSDSVIIPELEMGIRHFYGTNIPNIFAEKYGILDNEELQDLSRSFSHFLNSHNQGDPVAAFFLGYMYAYGLGVSKDQVTAGEYFQVMLDTNTGIGDRFSEYLNSVTEFELSRLFEADYDAPGQLGQSEQLQKAIDYMKKSAARGYYPAQVAMGTYYEIGKGVEQNILKAMIWYQIALQSDRKDNLESDVTDIVDKIGTVKVEELKRIAINCVHSKFSDCEVM